ncbi:anti-sigma B factor antagonist [Streptomyces sp. 3213]|uniref:STAS domain-containing protein n=1 Tax=Streptomyces sp. 3213.3 TaxID=1855348 RepID=UPI00089DA366|nr:STAS domain-containing protein [Streptomyces sp. 3213.3]SEC62357.1 anti-sigma B factor antagonist [Streptomyces sp. 3213] [Streptomyces sp. 3213.3]
MTAEADERDSPAANSCALTRSYGPFTVVEVSGEIDMATAGLVVEHLDAATAVAEPDVLVDLRPVEFLDCSGLRVLCRAEGRARERGGRLRIVSDGPRIDRLLRASGLLRRFPPLRALPSQEEKPQ